MFQNNKLCVGVFKEGADEVKRFVVCENGAPQSTDGGLVLAEYLLVRVCSDVAGGSFPKFILCDDFGDPLADLQTGEHCEVLLAEKIPLTMVVLNDTCTASCRHILPHRPNFVYHREGVSHKIRLSAKSEKRILQAEFATGRYVGSVFQVSATDVRPGMSVHSDDVGLELGESARVPVHAAA